MLQTAKKVKHSYIVSKKGHCSGRPIIAGTKFPVSSVVNYVIRQGMNQRNL